MRICDRYRGFTLIEVLIAMAMVVAVMTAVYGTYFTAMKSTRQCGDVMDAVRQGRFLLERLTTQLRCSYVPQKRASSKVQDNPSEVSSDALSKIVCFEGGLDKSGRSELCFITTKGWLNSDKDYKGMYRVGYRFDPAKKEMYYYEERYHSDKPCSKNDADWIEIADGIAGITLDSYDGQQWRQQWPADQIHETPQAARIQLEMDMNRNEPVVLNTSVSIIVCSGAGHAD